MKSSIHIWTFLTGLWLLHGCAGIYSSVSFEVLEPANVNLPEDVKFTAIINRSPLAYEMFEKEDVESLSKEQLRVIDTMISNNIMKGLNLKLRNSSLGAYKNPLWINMRRSDTLGLNIPFTKREVNDICNNYGCDAIISMEYYRLNIDELFNYNEGEIYNNYFEVSNIAKWAIYLRGSPRPFREYTTHDTIFFTRYADGLYYELPSSAEMLRATAFKSGESFGRYLVPSWSMLERLMYKGREHILKETNKSTNQGDWEGAYEIWKSLLEGEDSVLAAKAAYNMAVYHELEDDLLTALNYVLISEMLDSTVIAESYREDLQIRVLNRKQILKQLY